MEDPSGSIIEDQDDGRNGAGKKILKKIGVGFACVPRVLISTTSLCFTHGIRMAIGLFYGVKSDLAGFRVAQNFRERKIISGLFNGVLAFLLPLLAFSFHLVIWPFHMIRYLANSIVDAYRFVRATGEVGEKNEIETLNMFQPIGDDTVLQRREAGVKSYFLGAIGFETTVVRNDQYDENSLLDKIAMFGRKNFGRPITSILHIESEDRGNVWDNANPMP